MFSKFIGITQEVASLVEQRRTRPEQSENDILLEALAPRAAKRASLEEISTELKSYSVGQGASVRVGETLYLFLDEEAKKNRKPHGVAEVRGDGIYVDGKRVSQSRGSEITPAMRIFQARLGHKNDAGQTISLNAYLKWHVLRDGKLVSLNDLKDPALARRRSRTVSRADEAMLRELGLL